MGCEPWPNFGLSKGLVYPCMESYLTTGSVTGTSQWSASLLTQPLRSDGRRNLIHKVSLILQSHIHVW